MLRARVRGYIVHVLLPVQSDIICVLLPVLSYTIHAYTFRYVPGHKLQVQEYTQARIEVYTSTLVESTING